MRNEFVRFVAIPVIVFALFLSPFMSVSFAQNATNLPMVFYKNGHDVGQCVVDDSSKLRMGLTKKFPK